METDDRFGDCGYDLRALRVPYMMFVAELLDEPQSILPGYVSYHFERAVKPCPMYREKRTWDAHR